jgi:predicted ATP-grasp superfamily ATP-dependent carboligase
MSSGLKTSRGEPGPPALVAIADYYGTLATVRSLGRAGVAVRVADWRRFVPARWSRFSRGALDSPDLDTDPDAFLAWLLALGEREPGQVLLATSDDLAWLYARNRDALGRHFLLDVPPVEGIYPLLNKRRLHEACGAAGIPAPETILPRDERDLLCAGRDIGFPLMIKPQTQVGLRYHRKGKVVWKACDLARAYAEFCSTTVLWRGVTDQDPGASRALLQPYVKTATQGIYSLSGFIGRGGSPFLAHASRKLLQRPRRLGVGLCFEEADPVPELLEQMERLCRHIGYHGTFEVEFLEVNGGHLLIDFNPRLFGQIAFDVARGVDLPLIAYWAAAGDPERLAAALLSAAHAAGRKQDRVFCNQAYMRTQLALLRLAGRMGRDEVSGWRSWLVRHRGRVTDPARDMQDWLPFVVDLVRSVVMPAIHPRSAWRDARAK